MSSYFNETITLKELELLEYIKEDAYFKLLGEYNIMESHIVYFSAGEAKIKEILIKKDPSYSA